MSRLVANLFLVFFAFWSWSALPLPPPEIHSPRIISQGDDVVVPVLPWRWLTWNLQWFPGHRPQSPASLQNQHIQAVESYLKKIFPQVAILQEVLDSEGLAKATPAYPWRVLTDFQRAGDEDGKLPPQNVAMVSQWPWKEVWEIDFHHLPLTPDRPVRGFLGVVFQDDRGQKLTVYGVHLKSNRGGREASSKRRERAVDYLRWDWRRRGLDPVRDLILIGGDFNCSRKNPEFTEETLRGLIREGWVLANEELGWPEGATVKPDPEGRFPASDFDHFLLSPGYVKTLRGQKPQVKVHSGQDVPSDHYPVEMILRPDWK